MESTQTGGQTYVIRYPFKFAVTQQRAASFLNRDICRAGFSAAADLLCARQACMRMMVENPSQFFLTEIFQILSLDLNPHSLFDRGNTGSNRFCQSLDGNHAEAATFVGSFSSVVGGDLLTALEYFGPFFEIIPWWQAGVKAKGWYVKIGLP